YSANNDLVKGVQWVATLDSRTTPACQVRDGLQYDLNHRPVGHSVPWETGPGRLHWGCRWTSVPVLKSWRELGIRGGEVTQGMRASFNGQVPGRTTFGDWITRQSAAVQGEVLGVSRARALRAGDTSFADLYDDRGRLLSIAELRDMEAA